MPTVNAVVPQSAGFGLSEYCMSCVRHHHHQDHERVLPGQTTDSGQCISTTHHHHGVRLTAYGDGLGDLHGEPRSAWSLALVIEGDLERATRGLGGTARFELEVDAMALYSCLVRGVLMLLLARRLDTERNKKKRVGFGRATKRIEN